MTEREKMMKGEWYRAYSDEDLVTSREKAEWMCLEYNSARPGSKEQQEALFRILGAKAPDGLKILAPVYFDYGYNTHFGIGTFVNHGCYFMDGAEIIIGDYVFIGPFCGFYTASHPMKYIERNKGLEKASPIVVGDNCWFGGNVSVLPGVKIGSGSVIAAGSVVTEDLPDNCVAAGVPAVVKKILNQ